MTSSNTKQNTKNRFNRNSQSVFVAELVLDGDFYIHSTH